MKKLYIGNLPYEATEADLEAWFREAGVQTESVAIATDRFSGQSRGFAYAEVREASHANRAVNHCNGKVFSGRTLLVNFADQNVSR